jgi:hypothetical protein
MRATVHSEPATVLGFPRGWFYLAIGVPIALALSFGPLGFMGWFLRALVHELGHTAVAWFFGCPAFPAIRLDGHAAAFHQNQIVLFALAVWAGIGGLAWHLRAHRRLLGALWVLMVAYPLLAFTEAREVVHLLAGHLFELGFAAVFFWRALTGGFVKQEAERPLYAALGWLLMGGCISLFWSLSFSEGGRQAYASGGSFGLVNDLIRVTGYIHCRLGTAAIPMLLLSLVPLPLALFLQSRQERPAS